MLHSQPPIDNQALLSYPIIVADLPETGLKVTLQANAAECGAIAHRDSLNRLLSLSSSFELLLEKEGVHVIGKVTASMNRTCVVTLEDFEECLEEDVDVHFRYHIPQHAQHVELDENLPEQIIGGAIDLGALTLEFFELGLDPHPRKPEASFSWDNDDTPIEKPSPFAALKNMKKSS
jgi:uncharacterized metal-binding protein YceD (DUF177 family)